MNTELKNIELYIHIENATNKLVRAEVKNILPQLQPYLDKKIFTNKGKAMSFKVELLNNVPEAYNKGHVSIQCNYLTNNRGRIILSSSLCFNGGKYEDRTYYCQYSRREIELGTLTEDNYLESILELDKIISYNGLDKLIELKEELPKINSHLALEKQIEELKRSINIPYELYKFLKL